MGLLKWLRRNRPTVRDNADELIQSVLDEVSVSDNPSIYRDGIDWVLMENINYRNYVMRQLRKKLPNSHIEFATKRDPWRYELYVYHRNHPDIVGLTLNDRFTV